jgi:Tfp pilus assembly protein PilX
VNARGVVLIMGLILLAAISLLALASARGMVLQHRMAGNLAENAEALHNATLAASDARAWLESRADFERDAGCIADCLLPVAIRNAGELPPNPEFESAAWWRVNGLPAGVHPGTGDDLGYRSGGVEPARWIIEEIRYEPLDPELPDLSVAGTGYYRILARGSGNRHSSVAVSEAILARPWDGDYDPAPYPATEAPGSFCRQFGAPVACGTLAWRQRK